MFIIPKYIDGYEVCKTYTVSHKRANRFGGHYGEHKVYITFKFDEFDKDFFNGQKVMFIGNGLLNGKSYTSLHYYTFVPYNVDISTVDKIYDIRHANVTYMVDDEIYWIDECENGPIEYIPEEPKKDGFKFEGWYKDKDFLTKWDFKTDTVPPIKEIDHGDNWKNTWTEYVYEEVMLYAKFDLVS